MYSLIPTSGSNKHRVNKGLDNVLFKGILPYNFFFDMLLQLTSYNKKSFTVYENNYFKYPYLHTPVSRAPCLFMVFSFYTTIYGHGISI